MRERYASGLIQLHENQIRYWYAQNVCAIAMLYHWVAMNDLLIMNRERKKAQVEVEKSVYLSTDYASARDN